MTRRIANEAFMTEAQARASDCACIKADYPSSAILEAAIDQASDIIAAVSGMRIAGRQDVIARPERIDNYDCSPGYAGCDWIPLGDERPTVTRVKIDGAVIPSSLYWLRWDNVSWCIARRPDPTAGQITPPAWPSTQRQWLDDTDEHTFAIYFTQGIHVDDLIIQQAATEVLCQLLTAAKTSANGLEGISQINVGGTTAQVSQDLLDRIANGEMGPMMRQLMGVLNPEGRSPSMVWAPELMQGWNLNLRLG